MFRDEPLNDNDILVYWLVIGAHFGGSIVLGNDVRVQMGHGWFCVLGGWTLMADPGWVRYACVSTWVRDPLTLELGFSLSSLLYFLFELVVTGGIFLKILLTVHLLPPSQLVIHHAWRCLIPTYPISLTSTSHSSLPPNVQDANTIPNEHAYTARIIIYNDRCLWLWARQDRQGLVRRDGILQGPAEASVRDGRCAAGDGDTGGSVGVGDGVSVCSCVYKAWAV